MERFDAIVLGTGGVGSSALYHLAKRGLRVLGLDQFPQAHDRGGSHGQSRIIRQAYFEHADYVPLLLAAYQLWDEVEQKSNRKLFHQVGLLEVGPPDGVLIPGVLESVRQHNLPIESLTRQEAESKYPFAIPDDAHVLYEPTGGYLLVEQCVQTHLDLAMAAGATWRQEAALSWADHGSHVSVTTANETWEADQLILSGGAWSTHLQAELDVELSVVPRQQYWFDTGEHHDVASSLPTFFFELPTGCYYGFPDIANRGMKVAQHSGGTSHPGPVELHGRTNDEEEQAVRHFVSNHSKCCNQNLLAQQACMYTMSPDEHFIVDSHPEFDRVSFAAGLSGHGFKFTSVLGKVLADLATGTSPEPSIAFMGLGRF